MTPLQPENFVYVMLLLPTKHRYRCLLFFSGQRLKRSNVAGAFGEFLLHYSSNADKQYDFVFMSCKIRHAVNGHLKNAGKVSHKRRKSTQDAANSSNTNQMNESCLSPSGSQIMSPNILHDHSQQPSSHGTKCKAPANVTTRYVRQRLSRSGSHSSLADGRHDHNGIDKDSNSLLPITQEIPTLSQASAHTPTGLQHSGHRSDFHQSQGASDNDVNLGLDVATTDVTQSLHINNKRKAPANVTARTVQQRLSTNNSQSTSFEHSAGQSDFHQSEDQSPVYEDLGDCNERCRYCKAAFWHGECLKGHRDTRYNLCCGGGKVFRTARDKCAENDIPEFKVRLYNGNGARGYELPTSQAIGAIVFDSGPTTESDYDIIIEYRDGPAKRINKLHQSYMSLQFPLIFIYGQPGYHIKLMARSADPNERMRRVSMNAFYTYQLHPRHDSYNLLF
ncbi:helitron helicase-like domain-containing protein [Artemisia annua]|uniref:Helitron helicase-like domain-containing protein n=1 Tax=Artemisia annua TaxID=35608 RepID=A0A2U1L553_ARTAN|nr:helitron helicase-like domain-containing protein [Artemisia annua]